MNSLVSVIVPVYNVVDYMDNCISSIINQTYEKLEIIIVDDGSNDGSETKCEEWALRDSRIIVKHQENLGVSSARNEGMRLAKGDWIAFIDGDDFVPDDYIEILMEKSKDTDAQIIMCGYRYISKTASDYSFFCGDRTLHKKDRGTLILMALGLYNPMRNNASIGGPWSKIYKRSFLKEKEITFDESLPKMQDVIFNLYCFEYMDKAYYIDRSLYNYVHREESRVHAYSPDHYDIVDKVITALRKYFEVQDCLEKGEDVYNGKIMGLFLEIMKLEYIRHECPLSLFEKRNRIKKLCENSEIKIAITEKANCYLNKKMRLLQKILIAKGYLLAYFMIYVKYHNQYK